ncbi:DUF2835 domain-containing protein [Celerinatantimonas yamalensis]|uniref:DUF2835 domain-containing protein n=1 Tax=Celerinatantimonas yamalensis TaxID=559956 RepID=A0ABW9G524_9GAMM
MKQYLFNIYISYDEFLDVYRGVVKNLIVRSDSGLSLQIQACHFLPFLTQIGLRGRFRLTTDNKNKYVSLEKIS